MIGDLFEATPAGPEGFAYQPELFSESQERDLASRFPSLPFQPFEFHGHLGNRRIVSFGWRYDYGGRALRPAPAMPEFLQGLKEIVAGFSFIPDAEFRQVLVTEYAPSAGIGWHRDKPMFDSVVAFSFLAPCLLRFRQRQGDSWQRRSIAIAPRSGYLLRGAARAEWEHSIPPLDRLRYSVTFRNFRPDVILP